MKAAGYEPRVTLGFRIAGLFNVLGVHLFSLGFTNTVLMSRDPVVLSSFGLVSIILWGLAYLAVAKSYMHVPLLVGVFAIEKLVYTIAWLSWIFRFGSELPQLYSESPLTGVFYSIYGPGDFLFGVFFVWVAVRTLRNRPGSSFEEERHG